MTRCLASLLNDVCLEFRRRQAPQNPYGYFTPKILSALAAVRNVVPGLERYYAQLEDGLMLELVRELDQAEIKRLRESYDSALALAFPAVNVLLRIINAAAGYNYVHSLRCIGYETLLELEIRAHNSTDRDLKAMVADFLRRLSMSKGVEDYIAFGQAYEKFCEIVVYIYLKERLGSIERIPEQANVSTPDFRCRHLDRVFYVEVKSLDIVSGIHRARQMGLDGLDANLILERQKMAGARVAMSEQVIDPFKEFGDNDYDPRSQLMVIETIKEKVRGAFKSSQFDDVATVAWVCMGRLLIPQGKKDLMPYYLDGDGFSIVSGVLWQACFGKEGGVVTRAAEFEGMGTFEAYLPTNGLYCDPERQFPGIGTVFMETATLDSQTFGVFDKTILPTGWDLDELDELLGKVSGYRNDRSNAKAYEL